MRGDYKQLPVSSFQLPVKIPSRLPLPLTKLLRAVLPAAEVDTPLRITHIVHLVDG